MFYWGFSFLIMSVYLLLFAVTINIPNNYNYKVTLTYACEYIKLLSVLFQVFAISYVVGWCNKYGTSRCSNCNKCLRKHKRIMVTCLLFVVAIIPRLIPSKFILPNDGFYYVASWLNAYYSTAIIMICLWISFKLLPLMRYKISITYSYCLLAISQSVSIYNSFKTNFNITSYEIEWVFFLAYLMIMALEIMPYKIYNN